MKFHAEDNAILVAASSAACDECRCHDAERFEQMLEIHRLSLLIQLI
jgi:hypothetical protein